MAAKCAAAKRTEDKRGRGRAWVFVEQLCAVLVVTGVNQEWVSETKFPCGEESSSDTLKSRGLGELSHWRGSV